jgi:hypothetical protein
MKRKTKKKEGPKKIEKKQPKKLKKIEEEKNSDIKKEKKRKKLFFVIRKKVWVLPDRWKTIRFLHFYLALSAIPLKSH